MIKKVVMVTLIIVLLSGCTKTMGETTLLNHLDQLDQSLDDQDWEKLSNQAKELKSMYEDNKWKLQLLGDEGEFEGLNGSINKIIAATIEEDHANVRMEIATARTFIKDIYSL